MTIIDNSLAEAVMDALNYAEDTAEKCIQYSTLLLSVRRRIKAALELLEHGRSDEAKQMLEAALADDGGFMKRRLDKIVQAAWRDG